MPCLYLNFPITRLVLKPERIPVKSQPLFLQDKPCSVLNSHTEPKGQTDLKSQVSGPLERSLPLVLQVPKAYDGLELSFRHPEAGLGGATEGSEIPV